MTFCTYKTKKTRNNIKRDYWMVFLLLLKLTKENYKNDNSKGRINTKLSKRLRIEMTS